MEISLLDVFESDGSGVLALLRLAGLGRCGPDSGPARALHEVAAGAFASLREEPLNARLDAVWDRLEAGGWTLYEAPDEEPWRRWGPLLEPPGAMPREIAIELAAEALQSTFLWAAARAAALHWHGEEGSGFPHGVCDLHRRPDAFHARLPSIDTESPEIVQAVLGSHEPALEQACAALSLLPKLRSRLAMVLYFALDLSADEVVGVLCESCPEASELDLRRFSATTARAQGVNSLRVQNERARQAIEDALNSSDPRLAAMLQEARSVDLPEDLAALVARRGAVGGRAGRRWEAFGRLVWMIGAPGEAVARWFEASDPEVAETMAWPVLAERGPRLASGFEALGAAGEPLDLVLFLLRYAVHRHVHERPARETLASLLPGDLSGRAAGDAVGQRLVHARRRILANLSAPPESDDHRGEGAWVWPNAWAGVRPEPVEAAMHRQALREALGAGDGFLRAGARTRLRGRAPRFSWLWELARSARPGLVLAPAASLRGASEHAAPGQRMVLGLPDAQAGERLFVALDGPGGLEVIEPAAGAPWRAASELSELHFAAPGKPGTWRIVVAWIPEGLEPSTDPGARWRPIQQAIASGAAPSAACELELRVSGPPARSR